MKRVFHRRNIVSFLFVFCKIAQCYGFFFFRLTVIKLKKETDQTLGLSTS